MGRKITMYILGLLSIVFFGLGTFGFVSAEVIKENKEPVYSIKYNYYVDDQEVAEMPKNTDKINPEYTFNRYTCTNKVTGEWDDANWKFNANVINNATCKLYFNRSYYKVDFEIEYGELRNIDGTIMTEEEKEEDITVEREQNLVVKIKPDEGYSLVSVECDDNNVTDWDKENNELTVKSVKADTKCKVKFQISVYDVEIKVTNGQGATTLNVEHGKPVNASIIPTTGYGNPVIVCTNGQNGVWADNKFTIEKLENSTICDVSFSLFQYEISVNVVGGVATPSKSSAYYNGSREFSITPDDNHIITIGYGVTGCANGTLRYADGNLTLLVSDVTQNTTCTVNLQEKGVTPPSSSTETTQSEN